VSPGFDAPPLGGTLPDPCATLRYVGDRPIFRAFLEQAQRAPDALCLEWSEGVCSYGELERISRRLALCLRARGVGPGHSVAIVAERGPALIYAMLGALRSGATFYVADAAYPAARIEQCVRQLQPSMLLMCAQVQVSAQVTQLLADETKLVRVPASPETALAELGALVPDGPLAEVEPASDAYVMFTSGSTGQPKAVVTSHPPLVHFVQWHVRTHRFDDRERFSLLSGLSHDPVLRDIFTPLSIGAALCIPTQAVLFNPALLADWLRDRQISVCHLTPAMGEIIAEGAESSGTALPMLRAMFWGGDALNAKTSSRVHAVAPNARQVNFYGATETPQAMGFYPIDPSSPPAVYPIGRGIDAVQLLVVNATSELCAVGELGEIWVRTPYLSNGYQGDAAQTQSRFTPSPFSQQLSDVCYRTGDLGRYLPDGDITLAGRADHQVKVRGFRVEPAEIAAAIERVPGVARAVVVAKELPAGGKALVAYYTRTLPAAASASALALCPSPADIKQAVGRELPAYMVPAFVTQLEAFPLLPNGKIDIAGLPTADARDPVRPASYVAPTTAQERLLVDIWQDVLRSDNVGVNDSFLDIGGDSLSALMVMVRMQKLGLPDSVAQGILQGRTIRELAGGAAANDKLTPQAQTNLLVNIVRGVLVMLIVTEHWLAGFLPHVLTRIEPWLGVFFGLATPGFAGVFGVSLGYGYYTKYLVNRAQTARSLKLGAFVLSSAILLGGLVRVVIVLLQEGKIDVTRFFASFLSVLLYYLLAMGTVRLWFAFIARFKSPYVGCVTLIGLFLVSSRITWSLIGHLELTGFLQLAQTLLVAKFNYFKMSAGVLAGMMAGIALKKRERLPALLPTLGVALAAVTLAMALLRLVDGSLMRIHDGDDMRLWRWVFCAGAVLCIAALASDAITRRLAPGLARSFARLLGVVGQCALPFFVLHVLVIDVYVLLSLAKVPRALGLGLTIGPFLGFGGWMVARIYTLYYGTSSSERPSLRPS
jgi:amino acid adenylation domain-containing protein